MQPTPVGFPASAQKSVPFRDSSSLALPCVTYKALSNPWKGFQPGQSGRIKVKNKCKETMKLSGDFKELIEPGSYCVLWCLWYVSEWKGPVWAHQ